MQWKYSVGILWSFVVSLDMFKSFFVSVNVCFFKLINKSFFAMFVVMVVGLLFPIRRFDTSLIFVRNI